MDNRLVNRKLKQVMDQRSEKSRVNTITGTFAGLLRLGEFTPKQYKHLKNNFSPTGFLCYSKDEITVRLTDWIDKCLKSIENGSKDLDNYKGVLEKVLLDNKIQLPSGFEPLILEWLKYKSEKNQTYKETGLKKMITVFLKDSDSDLATAQGMLDYSMSKNYTGLFKDKSNGSDRRINQRTGERTDKLWDQQN
jgi:hypothetical protein